VAKSLKEFGDRLVKIHLQFLETTNHQQEPLLLFMQKNNSTGISRPVNDDQNPLEMVQQIIDKFTPELYLIISGGYMIKTDSIKNYSYGDATKSKDRIEVVQFLGKSLNGKETYSRVFQIIRKNDKTIYEEYKSPDGSRISFKSPKLT